MSRHVIFRHYWWIALVASAVGVAAVLVTPAEVGPKPTLIGSTIAAALGFCYFVQQQKCSETTLFWQMFARFNERYDKINDRLTQIAADGLVHPADRQVIVDYFNLCGEEYLFYKEGFIHRDAWQSWCRGMLWYFNRAEFKRVWDKEQDPTNSYYGLTLEAIEKGADS